MISIAIIIFREALEISLILGILLAATSEIKSRARWIWSGFTAGALGSLLLAAFAAVIAEAFEGIGQDLLNAAILLTTGGLIAWTVFWMEKHGRNLSAHLKSVASDIREFKKPMRTLSLVIALAVLREGSEIVLFTYGFLASGQSFLLALSGLLGGLSSGFLVGAIIYLGLIKISPKILFQTTGALLVVLASGMIAQGFAFLSIAGVVNILGEPLWDSSWLIREQSWSGQILKALAGYNARPSGIYLLAFTASGLIIGMIAYFPGNIAKQFKLPKIGKNCLLFLILFSVMSSGLIQPVRAQKIYSPHINGREIELELKSEYAMNDWVTFQNAQKYKTAFGIALTGFWFSELYGEFLAEPAGVLAMKSLELENRFMLAEPGEWFIDTGLYLAYKHTFDVASPEYLEFKVLFEKETGKFIHRMNPVLELNFGSSLNPDYSVKLAFGSHYRLNPFFEPGFELYANFGRFDQAQTHMGPVVYGKVGFFKYDFGYLFDISSLEKRTDSIKFNLEYEIYF